jgi:hypothetical protein
MAICDHKGCKRTAEVAPEIIVPHAVGFPFDPRRQLGVLLSLKLCRRCCLSFDVKAQVALPGFVGFVQQAGARQAKRFGLPYTEPDFARAKLEVVRLDSEKYRRLSPNIAGKPEIAPANQNRAGGS